MDWETVIGLEVHVQLSTFSKAFCSDSAVFGAPPNTQVSAISLGLPGTLPFFNQKQLEMAVRLGLALGGQINRSSHFDRKNYFYADLPKGFQTTQDREPICRGGEVEILGRSIRIHHFHMEEDAGKSIHDQAENDTLIDLNRAGVPLLEIVTEPDFRTAEEVAAFMTEIQRLVRWLDISDGNLEEGSLRCDVNLSLREKNGPLGTRCEIKNINSMRFAKRAIEFEAKRQSEILDAGGKIQQQTRSFDPATGRTAALRDKEDAHDYRYFPEPDLPVLVVSEAFLEKARAGMPILPRVLELEFSGKMGLAPADSALLTAEKKTAFFFKNLVEKGAAPKAAANLVIQKILPQFVDLELFKVEEKNLIELLVMLETGRVSASAAFQKLWPVMLERPSERPEKLADELQIFQTADSDFLEKLVAETLEKWPEKVAEYKKGKRGLLGFFTGEAMKSSRGKADPKVLSELFQEKLT